MEEERHAKKRKVEGGEVRVPVSNGELELVSAKESCDTVLMPQSIDDIGITELLEPDSRPTFVLDLQPSASSASDGLNVVFSNSALRFFDTLRNVILAESFFPFPSPPVSFQSPTLSQYPDSNAESEFKEWATCLAGLDSTMDGYLPRITFHGLFWTAVTLRNRWRVISASQVPNQLRQSHATPKSSRSTSRDRMTPSTSTDSAEPDLQKQLADSNSKFRVLTELSPVGMYYLNPAGDILYCNDMWYEITGHPRGLEGEMSFMNVISEVDHPKITEEWIILTTLKGKRIFELRLRNKSYDRDGNPRQKYILASCDQEFDEDGNLKSIMGCITDISEQKENEDHAKQRAELVETVALRTQEATQHEKAFKQMAELAPCGMFTFDPEGIITWANSQWYEMTGHSRSKDDHCPMSFLNFIEEQDHEEFRNQWRKLTVEKEEVSSQLRLKKPWIRQEGPGPVRDTTWILFLAVPQLDDNEKLSKVFGCTTDISHFKWAESVQLRSRLQAEEAKVQQENFIDMTSHEMRNPLSAMLMSADGIVNSLLAFQSANVRTAIMSQELVESNLDAAQTIVLCAMHQKRIIDDVLTLSKLNSKLLQVTPVQVEVEDTVRRTLKMFESELQANDIQITFEVEPSYNDAKIDKMICDPVRLTQIFINLLTNAIKFTRSEQKRHIFINLGASTSKPPNAAASDIQWFPSKDSAQLQDLTLSTEWGTGEQVYLYFAVRDTGRGLDEVEKTRLFHRFSQASPRTHVQYGGSGLGLFISRELTELQGGEIGVASTAGVGSTFAFYIKGRKSTSSQNSFTGPLHSRIFPDRTNYHITLPTLTAAETSEPTTPILEARTQHDYHILLVEDNLINQKVLSKQLRGIGCTVQVANHGRECLDFLARTTRWVDDTTNVNEQAMDLALILMDLEMPIMDGLTCARGIRDLERRGKLKGHVPIIAVTANARVEQMDVALEAGMDDIVPKPFQITELIQKIDCLMLRAGIHGPVEKGSQL